jgi:hypothetical protein
MAGNSNSLVAVKTESASGRAVRATHKATKAGVVARKKPEDISSRVRALRRQLQENTEGLKCALR